MPQQLDLIVGLGNPGAEHLLTRHNAGFWFVDALAEQCGVRFKHDRKLHAEAADIRLAGQRLRVLKPQTYMNDSGRSVQAALAYYKIDPEHMLVAYDELDLPPGRAKLKLGGGHAGHNGVRSIIEHTGRNFWRLRLGVGHPGHKARVVNYVLSRASADDETRILETIGDALAVVPAFIEEGAQRATQQLHRRRAHANGQNEPRQNPQE